jgi:hypothetical protein
VQAEYADIGATVKARLRAIPTAVAERLASETRPAVIQAQLLERIDDALSELARGVHAVPADDDQAPESSEPNMDGATTEAFA